MKVTDVKINGIVNPVGFALPRCFGFMEGGGRGGSKTGKRRNIGGGGRAYGTDTCAQAGQARLCGRRESSSRLHRGRFITCR